MQLEKGSADSEEASGVAVRFVGAGVVEMRMVQPASRNAMCAASVAAMQGALAALASHPQCGCIVLTASGSGFCAGSNLKELHTLDAEGRAGFEQACGQLSRALVAFPFPVIAAVHGFAVGGGLTLAASCDIVLSTADARWSLPEVPIGLFPAWGLAPVVTRCGLVAAKRLSWGVDVLDGHSAWRLGLVDEIAADPEAAALALATRLAALPRLQAACVKRYFAEPLAGEAADQRSNQLFGEMAETAEAKATLQKYAGR
ncbi:MAG: enoyl-CoA hydratase/isomerase [Rhodoferax sp.]|nr:enoyl-CoA hydratase/isomerase [Rhodoferax sp.]